MHVGWPGYACIARVGVADESLLDVPVKLLSNVHDEGHGGGSITFHTKLLYSFFDFPHSSHIPKKS